MKVKQVVDEWDNGCKQCLRILVDDKTCFYVNDGEPEDNTLYRNFGDCFGVIDLMEMAYMAGKRGEPFEVIE